MRNIAAPLILSFASLSSWALGARQCPSGTFPLNLSSLVISAPLAVSEVEARESRSVEISGKTVRQPFGYEFKEWLSFKAHMLPSDQIVSFSPPPKAFGGEEGYYLVRRGCVVKALTIVIIN